MVRLVEDNPENTTGQQVHSGLCPCSLKHRVAATLNLEHLPDPLSSGPKVKFCDRQIFHQSLRTVALRPCRSLPTDVGSLETPQREGGMGSFLTLVAKGGAWPFPAAG